MNVTSIDLQSIEKELQLKIIKFEGFKDDFPDSNRSKEIYLDMILLLKSLYSEVLNLQKSLEIYSNLGTRNSNSIITFNNSDSEFVFKVQLLSKKLSLPIYTVLNHLMEYLLNIIKFDDYKIDFDKIQYKLLLKKLFQNKIEITLSNKDFLEVMGSDLKNSDIKFNFDGIEILILKNISISDFEESIGYIKNCQMVFIPATIHRLLIYSKCKDIQSIRIYENYEDVYDTIFIFT